MALKALAINRHQDDLAARGTGEQSAAEVMQVAFNEIERTRQVKNRHQASDGAKNELATHLNGSRSGGEMREVVAL
jgi:hypothetical protein